MHSMPQIMYVSDVTTTNFFISGKTPFLDFALKYKKQERCCFNSYYCSNQILSEIINVKAKVKCNAS